MPNCTGKHRLELHTPWISSLILSTCLFFFLSSFVFTNPAQATQQAEIHKYIKIWTLLIEFTPLGWIHDWVTKTHFQMLGCSHRYRVSSSVHENASWLCKVALTGLGLGVYDSMSLYITTSDYFCYSYWFTTTIRQTYLLNYTFKTDFTSIIWLLKSRVQFSRKDPSLNFSARAGLSGLSV